ncbi:MAG: hypothetical protein WCL27_10545 [Betaproteobacteria bacterium]
MFQLSNDEKEKLIIGIESAFSIPFIDDIEDFIWEAVFAYAKSIPLLDPLTGIRSKRLFDLVDPATHIGWSAKALQCSIYPGVEFELVIQRADIFKKFNELGFPRLSVNSPTDQLGAALLKHWDNFKVESDMAFQEVSDPRVCILLKSKDRKRFAYFEDTLERHNPTEIEWKWSDASKVGLQGIRKSDQFVKYRWYPNQKQFFERFALPLDAEIFSLTPMRIPLTEVINILKLRLNEIRSEV